MLTETYPTGPAGITVPMLETRTKGRDPLTAFRAPAELLDELRKVAAAHERSASELIRSAVTRELDRLREGATR
jgi:hypothetical protein